MRRKRRLKLDEKDKAVLAALIRDQDVDRRRDVLLTRHRPPSQKTTRHVDDLGRCAEDAVRR